MIHQKDILTVMRDFVNGSDSLRMFNTRDTQAVRTFSRHVTYLDLSLTFKCKTNQEIRQKIQNKHHVYKKTDISTNICPI